ncbi:hypothetical protein ACTWPT_36090 [Nonomuraea sp. 3N208]|uniref:hypothetical protein n=1 Tax=Nonomuraea sp. 3N208 TaxID=3457421 RepID=UPI003FD56A7B
MIRVIGAALGAASEGDWRLLATWSRSLRQKTSTRLRPSTPPRSAITFEVIDAARDALVIGIS